MRDGATLSWLTLQRLMKKNQLYWKRPADLERLSKMSSSFSTMTNRSNLRSGLMTMEKLAELVLPPPSNMDQMDCQRLKSGSLMGKSTESMDLRLLDTTQVTTTLQSTSLGKKRGVLTERCIAMVMNPLCDTTLRTVLYI